MMNELAENVLSAYRSRGWTIATAESCTGGMVAASLTEIAGSSDVFDCAFITYSNAAKMQMVGVSEAVLAKHGAVAVETAREMANGALNMAKTDIAVSITGIAGPGPSEHKPEGRVCFALAQVGKPTYTEVVEFGAIGRSNVRKKSAVFALKLLLNAAK